MDMAQNSAPPPQSDGSHPQIGEFLKVLHGFPKLVLVTSPDEVQISIIVQSLPLCFPSLVHCFSFQ